ncbi:hypothetical protein DFH08DRAFT_1043368 [Mycena albidolilacea]|uniref:Uncharacterized protein n=1 Tax=Mycena albidolilacea TaxID=1033008 RepID=A0AAD7F0Q9_9AGAR|nr:hypothetical protein DFH08DRAFT_1043368 [Mycena albidolilacea]
MSRAGITAMGIGKMWTGEGKRVWMKSEEEDENKGRSRRDHGEDALPIHAPSCESYDCSGARTRTGVMWMRGELAYADVCELSEEGESQLSLACSSSYMPLLFPAVVFQHLPHFYASDGGVGRRGADTSPGSATRKQGGPARIDAHKRGTRRAQASEVTPSPSSTAQVWATTPTSIQDCLRPGPFSLLLAVGTPADRHAAETAKAGSRFATPSSGPDSAVQRISDTVVALVSHLRPFSLLLLAPPLLHTIGGGTHNHTRAHEDRRHERAEARTDRHALRRCRGADGVGREAMNGARQGGETLRGDCKASEARWAGDGTTPTAAQIRVREAWVLREGTREHTASVVGSGDSEGCALESTSGRVGSQVASVVDRTGLRMAAKDGNPERRKEDELVFDVRTPILPKHHVQCQIGAQLPSPTTVLPEVLLKRYLQVVDFPPRRQWKVCSAAPRGFTYMSCLYGILSNGFNLVPLISCTKLIRAKAPSDSLSNLESFVPFKIKMLSSRAAQIDAKRLINVWLVKPFPTGTYCYPVRKLWYLNGNATQCVFPIICFSAKRRDSRLSSVYNNNFEFLISGAVLQLGLFTVRTVYGGTLAQYGYGYVPGCDMTEITSVDCRKSCLAINKAILRVRAAHDTQKVSVPCRFAATRYIPHPPLYLFGKTHRHDRFGSTALPLEAGRRRTVQGPRQTRTQRRAVSFHLHDLIYLPLYTLLWNSPRDFLDIDIIAHTAQTIPYFSYKTGMLAAG